MFKPPRTDVCNTCAKYETMINSATDDQAKANVEASRVEHLAIAQVPRDLLRQNEQMAGNGQNPNLKVVCMDLQQTLPCPRLSTGIAYYKRKLWLYNFCVYDLNEKQGTMFMWNETVAGRGSDEMASCLLKWLKIKVYQQKQDFLFLRIFWDNCAGQNKNINMLLEALQQVHMKRLFRVEFMFLKSGHSYLPCDRAFRSIEKRIRKRESIATPQDYHEIIRSAVKKKFLVVPMTRDDFFDVKALQNEVSRRSTPGFSKACQLVVSHTYPEGYIIKNYYNLEDVAADIIKIRLMKERSGYTVQRFNLGSVQLACKYPDSRLFTAEKCQDLRVLAGLLGDQAKAWFTALLDEQDRLRQRRLSGVAPDPQEEAE
ncbi:hypothetical protein GWK47_005156 [Chionoecetes opilio]|uniref:DUF7869 domain-containing protein n=1 Tax=Chionoecetes opilio TaxID=41210 RepID=A0A8J5CL36_CHIOP|nr:hypothetical protein GWK47_005156 [Chionoecetes opilio]